MSAERKLRRRNARYGEGETAMGQYKVPQNVEAEDKILGPLTMKQFIYALIGFGAGLLCFAVFRTIPALMIVIGGPIVVLFMLLAFYNRDGQNFEQLLLALVGFFAHTRKRIWIKDDVIESYHVEPIKVVAEQSQRNPVEVRSELEKLATLIDSRGWNLPPEPDTHQIMPVTASADRLVAPAATPNQNAGQPKPSEDILDFKHSPLAQNLASLIEEAAADVREEAIEQMKSRSRASGDSTVIAPSISGVTATNANDILKLATERDDLTVSQLAASATRSATLSEGQSVELRNNGTAAN